MKTTYTATFWNGQTVTRKTNRAYSYAWGALLNRGSEGNRLASGFSSTLKGVETALNDIIRRWKKDCLKTEVVAAKVIKE